MTEPRYSNDVFVNDSIVVRTQIYNSIVDDGSVDGYCRISDGYAGINLDIYSEASLAELNVLIDVLVDYVSAFKELAGQ